MENNKQDNLQNLDQVSKTPPIHVELKWYQHKASILVATLIAVATISSGLYFSINKANNDYKNFTYSVVDLKTRCVDDGPNTVIYCDSALISTNNSTKQELVLVPSFWKAIAGLEEPRASVELIFVNRGSVFIEAYSFGPEGFRSDIGYYRYNIKSKEITRLSYVNGWYSETSMDGAYIATEYPIGATSEVRVFSLNEDKYVYQYVLSGPQSFEDGTYQGMGGDSPFSWEQDNILSFTIYDASSPSSDDYNMIPYPIIEQKEINNFPALVK